MTEDQEYSLAWNLFHEKDGKVIALKEEIKEHKGLLNRVTTVADFYIEKQQIISLTSALEKLEYAAKKALFNDGNVEPLLSELRGEIREPISLTSKPSRSKGVSGLSVAEICAANWPTPLGAPSINSILEKRPKWASHACLKGGRAGKSSHLWNPALLALCLSETTPQKKWACTKGALDKFIRSVFPEYLDEWEEYKQGL